MAVFTHVSAADLRRFLETYGLRLRSFEGIESGAENTNYRLETDRGRFVLTLFERRAVAADLPYFLAFMAHLSARGVPAPAPLNGSDGSPLGGLCGKPAVIVTFLEGEARSCPSVEECRIFGAFLARMHAAGGDFPLHRLNDLGVQNWARLAERCRAEADGCAPGLAALIDDELQYLEAAWPRDLPRGAVHADLFPDNLFFDGAAISGVIDFYFACTDSYAYDLAIALNSWAARAGAWSPQKAAALIAGYDIARRLSRAERAALPVLLRGAALRFLLTRLFDSLNRIEGALVTVKDPLEFRDVLAIHRAAAPGALYGFSQ